MPCTNTLNFVQGFLIKNEAVVQIKSEFLQFQSRKGTTKFRTLNLL